MNQRPHWRLYYVIAFFAHLAMWLFFSLALPHLMAQPEAQPPADELEWQTVEEEMPGDDAQEEPAQPEPQPQAAAKPAPAPEPSETPPTEVLDAPVEDAAPVVADSPEEAIAKLQAAEASDESKLSGNVAVRGNQGGQTMGQPAKLIREVQPAAGAISFRGRISVSAHIDKTGRVASTKIMISSGNTVYDHVAMNIVKQQWQFQPATDVEGKPMESNYICSLYFNVPPHRKN